MLIQVIIHTEIGKIEKKGKSRQEKILNMKKLKNERKQLR